MSLIVAASRPAVSGYAKDRRRAADRTTSWLSAANASSMPASRPRCDAASRTPSKRSAARRASTAYDPGWPTGRRYCAAAVQLIEMFTASKTGDDTLNEDTLAVTEHMAAVFDGETSKDDPRREPAPGWLASRACAAAVAELEPGCEPAEIAAVLHDAVRALDAGPGAAASGAVLDAASKRVVRIGDVSVGVAGRFNIGAKPADRVAAAARAALAAALAAAGVSPEDLSANDPGRAMVMPLLLAQRVWRNHPDTAWGFGCIDGTATPPELIDVFYVPDGAEVVIASDGYDDPLATLAQTEASLAESLLRDPMRVARHPSTKGIAAGAVSFDDRSYLRVRLN